MTDYKKPDEVMTPLMAEIIKAYDRVHGDGAAERELNRGNNGNNDR